MIDFTATNIQRLCITFVGNKSKYEGVSIPKNVLVPVHEYAHELLIATFFKPFEKTEQFFYFHHEEDVSHNLAYQRCVEIFENPDSLPDAAAKFTAQLYESMLSPRANGGEFFTAFFDEVVLNGESCRAIGLFKVNSRDPFFRVEKTAESFSLQVSEGVPSGKLETAAIIFGMDEAEGFRICVIDSVSKKDELSFWKDDFLRIRPIEDHFFNTTHYMKLAGEFITQHAPRKFGFDRPAQIDLMYRTANYFKDNEAFEVENFAENLFEEPEQQEAFKNFKDEYAQKNALPLEEKFDISQQAVKREVKIFKSVIKLDKNFHIYVHGRRDLIERGFDDEKGKKFYKVYFDEEI